MRRIHVTWFILAAILLVVGSIILLVTWSRQPHTPLEVAAHETTQLQDRLTDLERQLRANDKLPEYIHALDTIDSICSRVASSYETAVSDQITSKTEAQTIARTAEMCKDIVGLTAVASQHSKAVKPLLTIRTSATYFQTLPFIRDTVRNRHVEALQTSKRNLAELTTNSDYPFNDSKLIRSLEVAMKNSRDLGYLSQLKSFQQQIGNEQLSYWSNYAGLGMLITEIDSQISSYCAHSNSRLPAATCEKLD